MTFRKEPPFCLRQIKIIQLSMWGGMQTYRKVKQWYTIVAALQGIKLLFPTSYLRLGVCNIPVAFHITIFLDVIVNVLSRYTAQHPVICRDDTGLSATA
jgi:hypothetical protein